MSREDLLALTPEALAALANMGLVKRAQREIAEGIGPRVEEDAAGTVTGTFPDGVVAKLPRATPLNDAPCTCGAAKACRHRIAVALAYPAWAKAGAAAQDAEWSPAEVDDATLERALGKRLYEAAKATRDRGLIVTLELTGVPTAKLPSCSVRFLVPRDVAYAKCDCVNSGGACEHLALAVWAFRALPAGSAGAVVQLGQAGRGAPARAAALEQALGLARDLLDAGTATAPSMATRFARVRDAVDGAGLTWLHALVCDLEIALEGHARRSARFGAREIAELVTQLAARARAGGREGSELPPRYILGEDQARETLLDHVRLISLGARVSHDGTARFADVYLADPDTATVLVLSKRWDYEPPAVPDEGPDLARRSMATRMTLGALAHAHVVSRSVTRGANRSLSFGSQFAGRSSLTPQSGDFSGLPAPLLVNDLTAHAKFVAARPPRLLRPRVLAEEVHVVAVSRVHDVVYLEAEQTLVARLFDAAGTAFLLSLEYRRSAPHAIGATAAALAHGVRFVAGDLALRGGIWTLVPISLTADSFVVPDVSAPLPSGVHPALISSGRRASEDRLESALTTAESALQELCHAGLKAPSRSVIERTRKAAAQLEDLGMPRLARRLGALATPRPSADAWLDAAIRVALVREGEARVGSAENR